MARLLSFCLISSLNGCWSHFPLNGYLGWNAYHSCFRVGIMKGVFIIDFRLHDFMTGMCGDDAIGIDSAMAAHTSKFKRLKIPSESDQPYIRCLTSRICTMMVN